MRPNHSGSNVVRFWFDYLSAFAFLGLQLVEELCSRRGYRIEYVPVFLPGLLAANQQVGSVEIEAKRAYVFKHALRLAAQHGLKLNVPCHHPFKSLLALRVTALSSPSTRPLLVEGLFRAAWLLEQDLADPAVVKQCLANAGEAPELLATAAQEPAKAAVRDNTDAALAAGVFGVPTFGYAGELFWGCDSIPHLAAALDGYTQVDPSLHERWQRLARS